MEVIFAALCQDTLLDRDSNTFSLIKVIEEIGIPTALPESGPTQSTDDKRRLSPGNFSMVIWWARTDESTPERGRGRIRVVLPDGKEPLSPEIDVDLSTFLRLRYVMHFPGLPEGGPGTYFFVVEYKSGAEQWAEKFRYPLRVTIGPPTMPGRE